MLAEGRYSRGVLAAEQAGGGTGEQVLNPAAGARQFRASAGAAPALSARNRHPGGVGAPPGGTMASCQELADDRWAQCARESAARRRKENAAAERREARRPASWAGDLRRSEDRPDREAGHRVRRFRTSACRRSAPLIFRERKQTKGTRPPTGRRSIGCAIEERGAEHALNRASYFFSAPDRARIALAPAAGIDQR